MADTKITGYKQSYINLTNNVVYTYNITDINANVCILRNPSVTTRILFGDDPYLSETRYQEQAYIDGKGVFIKPAGYIDTIYLLAVGDDINRVCIELIAVDNPSIYIAPAAPQAGGVGENVTILADGVGLARDNSFPSALTASGNFKVAVQEALPAGANNIGKVTVDGIVAGDSIKPATTPKIYNITMTNADTEYSQALDSGCKKFEINMREGDTAFRLAFETGKVATPTEPYRTIPSGASYFEDGLNLSSKTLYFACSTAGKHIEITVWV